MKKIHFAIGNKTPGIAYCGYIWVKTTNNYELVTCKLCKDK